ncbi:MAG: hypothetical protein EXR62_01680 [Chloroflexi bacterium]|nr:hypothetical protein [Chloroflexota bacterium]
MNQVDVWHFIKHKLLDTPDLLMAGSAVQVNQSLLEELGELIILPALPLVEPKSRRAEVRLAEVGQVTCDVVAHTAAGSQEIEAAIADALGKILLANSKHLFLEPKIFENRSGERHY